MTFFECKVNNDVINTLSIVKEKNGIVTVCQRLNYNLHILFFNAKKKNLLQIDLLGNAQTDAYENIFLKRNCCEVYNIMV